MDVTGFDAGPRQDRAPMPEAGEDVQGLVDVILVDAPSGFDVPLTPLDASRYDSAGAMSDAGDPCTTISEQYAALVRGAQSCSVRTDCSMLVCETLCCNCEVYIAQASARQQLETLQQQWRSVQCDLRTTCIATRCDRPVAAECTSSGRCATVRGIGD